MIAQQGVVVKTVEDFAIVRIGKISGCAECDAGRGCGAGIFARLLIKSPVEVCVANEIGASAGQAVDLGMRESDFLTLVFKLYGMPLLAGLLGAGMCWWLISGYAQTAILKDLISLAGGVAAAGLVIWTNRLSAREFPGHNAVHLMEVVDSRNARHCDRI